MRDLAEKWSAVPDWETASIEFLDTKIVTLTGLSQLLVSGDLCAWARASGITDITAGASSIASGERYAIRIGRDRVLAVSAKPFGIAAGWHEQGFAVSFIDAGLHVFEIDGPQAPEILARATTLDPNGSSASAAMLFAGVNAVVYRHGNAERVRVHADRGLAPYLWQWFEQVCS
jgi:sarcosine oxidase gamma subunit